MLNTDSFVIIDPYNWWPNSHELFEGFHCLNIDFIFFTNFENSRIRAKKLFKRKNFLMKALECFYLIPYLLVKYRKCNVILIRCHGAFCMACRGYAEIVRYSVLYFVQVLYNLFSDSRINAKIYVVDLHKHTIMKTKWRQHCAISAWI